MRSPPYLKIFRLSRQRLLLLAFGGISTYSLYKLYTKRQTLSNLIQTLASISETLALVSGDLNRFLKSDSNEIPNSLKQFSKILKSNEVLQSVSSLSTALTAGIIKGSNHNAHNNSDFTDRVFENLFSEHGTGFASIVVGSFARNLVIGFNEPGGSSENDSSFLSWVRVISGDEKCKKLIGNCVEVFVRTAVEVYLDKTKDVNTYDEFFSGITNGKHEEKVKELLVMVCNGAVETLVRTSHDVLNNSSPSSSISKFELERKLKSDNDTSGWFNQVSSTLAVPSNRRFVLDVTGRVTFETVRSFLEFVMWKLYDGAKRGVNAVNEGAVERGLDVVRFCSAKTMLVITICLALCMRVMAGAQVLMPT